MIQSGAFLNHHGLCVPKYSVYNGNVLSLRSNGSHTEVIHFNSKRTCKQFKNSRILLGRLTLAERFTASIKTNESTVCCSLQLAFWLHQDVSRVCRSRCAACWKTGEPGVDITSWVMPFGLDTSRYTVPNQSVVSEWII